MRNLLAGLLLLALVLALVVVRYSEPAPRGEEAPAAEFSAARAGALLREIAGPQRPHPVGSVENARVRARVAAVLARLGYRVEEQDAVGCHPAGQCARVRNLIARLPGREPDGTLLLATHYDSVAAGPGVGDDLVGVAALLETARALRAGRLPRHTIVFLIDDGEEAGLLGAHAFMAQHPLAREVDFVVNVEARGTAGPSLMFETDRDNAWAVGRFARAAPRPLTSSLFSTIYERMPNDTDFTVFKAAGLRGLNFAFIGRPAHYHTPLDNLANTSAGSLQHHGENLLAAARALADGDLTRAPRGAAVFFDVLGWFVVRWPVGWTIPLALLALALLGVTAVRLDRRARLPRSRVALGLLAAPAMTLAAAVAGVLLGLALISRGSYAARWLAEPLAVAPFWLGAIAAGLFAAAPLARRVGAEAAWLGVWTFWALLALVVGATLPGLSFLFIAPALLAGLAGALAPGAVAAALLPLAAAGALWFPIVRFLPDALAMGILPTVAALVGLATSGLVPLAATVEKRAGRWVAAGLALAALAFAGWGLALPPFTPTSPQALNVGFHQDFDAAGRTVRSRLYSYSTPEPQRLPRPLADAAAWRDEPQPLYPWVDAGVLEAPAAPLALPPPEVVVAGSGRLRLISRRGAPIVGIALPPDAGVRGATVAGTPVPEAAGRGSGPSTPGWRVFTYTGAPPEGVEVELARDGGRPIEAYVFDRSYGLPPVGEQVVRRRPSTAVPLGGGDVTVFTRAVQVPPAP
ncbi:MAG TPA: M28 family peptidase [Thermoanaerobaculia bacterium]|nr:M28 family peptidase [Thermoanaerobaculia bacterium]